MTPRPLCSSRRPVRSLALLGIAAIAATACGGSESSAPATTAPITTSAPTTTVDADDDLPAEPAATTAAPSTAAPTTAPPTTAAPTTAPPATAPPVRPEALAQFCFESEQVYLADRISSLDIEFTPAQVEAAITFMMFSAQQAVATAPEGFGDEPTRFVEIVAVLDALYAEHGYDLDEIQANIDFETVAPLFDEYDAILSDRLVPFLEDTCGTHLDVLEAQGAKLGPVIDLVSDWPLVAITNQAGDIRLLVPFDWADTIGSLELGEVTVLQATTDTAAFEQSWGVPGVLATVYYVEAGVAEPATRIPGTAAAADCGAPVSVEPYSDPVYEGELHLYVDCLGTGAAAAVLAVTNEDADVEIVLELQAPDGPNRELLDQMLAGFAAGA